MEFQLILAKYNTSYLERDVPMSVDLKYFTFEPPPDISKEIEEAIRQGYILQRFGPKQESFYLGRSNVY